jgi:tRNA (guanine-N7-)-methyltransferase
MGSRVRKRPVVRSAIAPYILPPLENGGVLHWTEVFGNEKPVEIEVGFGKGRYLLTAAELRPQHNFLGLEISHGLVDFAADRLRIRTLTHAKVMKADALQILAESVSEASVAAIHFYFPDPWWKKRHYKRRVYKPELFQAMVRALRSQGCLHIASDVPFVFDQLHRLASAISGWQEVPPEPLPCTTNFEDKANRDGRMIQRTAFQKSGDQIH